MSIDKIQALINNMAPQEAASALALILKNLFPLLNEDTRVKFVTDLIDDAGDDKVSSMVHL
ncbi:MAG: hypothetical protein LJE66_02620 [Desulfobacterales bacterium]|jgi:hypothetical protein|nr:hypothetical protein [Desulfobacterales bacterium]